MKSFFADTYYYIALLNEDDTHHDQVIQFNVDFKNPVITTGYVLLEVADAMSRVQHRHLLTELIRRLKASPQAKIVPASEALFNEGLALFISRADKEWSLTDCISFVVMKREGIEEALTGDRHFNQAGFRALFAE